MSANTVYKVTLRVSSYYLPTLLQVIDKTKGIALANVSLDTADPQARTAEHPARYVNGKRSKGISGDELFMDTMASAKNKRVTVKQMEDVFVKRGFSIKSPAPLAYKLAKEGKIARDKEGYTLKG